MAEYIDIDKSYDTATLEDWYINSVTDDAPIWTEEHLEELLNDFYVIPKDTPAADVVEVVRCRDCEWTDNVFFKTKVIWCDHDEQWVEEDNFCKYGSRRKSDEAC